jgi:hypothetical protein
MASFGQEDRDIVNEEQRILARHPSIGAIYGIYRNGLGKRKKRLTRPLGMTCRMKPWTAI